MSGIQWDRIEPVETTSVSDKTHTPESLARLLEKETRKGRIVRVRDLEKPSAWVMKITDADDLLEKAREALDRAGKFGIMFADY